MTTSIVAGNNDSNNNNAHHQALSQGDADVLADHDATDEGSEVLGFLSEESIDHETFDDEIMLEEEERFFHSSFVRLAGLMVCVLVIAALALVIPGIHSYSHRFEYLREPARPPVLYGCPNPEALQQAENYVPEFNANYVTVAEQIATNITEFLATFRESNFDNWGKTYEQVKQGMDAFKSKYYPPYLNEGDSIYESACGLGLNLYMTLEILQQTKGIERLFVYGNDNIPVSVDVANAVFDKAPPAGSIKGVICPADSTNLSFIPANSFDLVFTGYIR